MFRVAGKMAAKTKPFEAMGGGKVGSVVVFLFILVNFCTSGVFADICRMQPQVILGVLLIKLFSGYKGR